MTDLLAAARAELGQSAEADQVAQQTGEDAASLANALPADPTMILDQIEAHLKDLEVAATQSDPSPVASDQNPTPRPPGRRRR